MKTAHDYLRPYVGAEPGTYAEVAAAEEYQPRLPDQVFPYCVPQEPH